MILGDDYDINLALTDIEQYILDTNPFLDPLSPVYVKDAPEEVFMQSPLFRQVHRLLLIISESGTAGVKFTQAGNLPGPVVRELYALGVPEWQVEEYYKSLSSETKCFSVGFAKIVALHCKLIRRYKGRFLLSKKGAALQDSPREMFALILNALCADFNFGYFDGFDEMPGNFTGVATMYLFLHQSGHEWLISSEYVDRFLLANPDIAEYEVIEDSRFRSSLRHCIEFRIFERHLHQLGLIETQPRVAAFPFNHMEPTPIRVTPLFDNLIGFRLSLASSRIPNTAPLTFNSKYLS